MATKLGFFPHVSKNPIAALFFWSVSLYLLRIKRNRMHTQKSESFAVHIELAWGVFI